MPLTRPLVLIGFMGSGKSTVGRRAAELTGRHFQDLDEVIEEEAGRTIPAIFADEGEAAFRVREAAVLRRSLRAGGILAVGGGTPVDERSWALLRSRALTIWLDAPLEVMLARVDGTGRPLLNGRPAAEVAALYRGRAGRYGEAEYRVDAVAPVDQVAREVVRRWEA